MLKNKNDIYKKDITPLDIKDFRRQTGLSRVKLAKILNCHKCTIYGWENGVIHMNGIVKRALQSVFYEFML